MKRPSEQLLHAAHALAEFMSWSHDPATQVAPGFVAPGQYQPVGQVAHVAGVVGVGGAVWREPAAHELTGVHEPALIMFE